MADVKLPTQTNEFAIGNLQSAILLNNAETDVTGADGCVASAGAGP
jgi:hypothetical protein